MHPVYQTNGHRQMEIMNAKVVSLMKVQLGFHICKDFHGNNVKIVKVLSWFEFKHEMNE